MLSCQEVTELITRYLERRMPPGERLRFLVHISMCPHCRRYLRQMRATVRALGQLSTEPPPQEVREAMRQHLRHWKKGRE
jgi:anti-sigma factor RsiW